MKKHCIVCRNSHAIVIFDEFGTDILRCTNCRHVFSSYNAKQDYNAYFGHEAADSKTHFWWDDAHKSMYNDFCRRFIRDRGGTLLDVGCGLGYFVKRVSEFPSWQIFGYEISPQAVDFARQQLGLQNVFCGRVEESDFKKHSCDIITLWDVIEHIPNPDPLLSHLSSLLKNDGVLFMHTPNIAFQLPKARLKKFLRGMRPGIHYLEAKDHVNIYSMKTIRTVLSRNGFSDVTFTHFKPIQSVSGSRSQLSRFAKNLWYYSSVGLSLASFGRVNLDNLFVIARP